MTQYLVRRLLEMVFVIFAVMLLVFVGSRLAPGDPVKMLLGQAGARNPAAVERAEKKMGLDKPVPVQFFYWLRNALTGDLGKSYRSGIPVLHLIADRLPATLELMLVAVFIGLVVSVPASIIAALNRGSVFDRFIMGFAAFGLSIPGFWLGLTLILLFAVQLDLLPASGSVPLSENPIDNLKHVVMPAAVLAVRRVAIYARFLRAQLIEVMQEDYIRTAMSKGLTMRDVVVYHALKNALIPFVTIVGIDAGGLIGGVVIIEQVFGYVGIGWLSLQALLTRDYAVVQGTVLVITIGFSLLNLLVDILYIYLNPRIAESLGRGT